MTSPYAFYQYWINVEDASVVTLLKVFTDRAPEEIAELEQSLAEKPFLREAQKALAADVTTLVHGAAHGRGAGGLRGAVRQGRPVRALDARTLADATAELPGGEVLSGMSVTDALVAVGTGGVAQRRAPGDRRRRRVGQQRQDRPTRRQLLARPTSCTAGSRCSGGVASRSPQAAALRLSRRPAGRRLTEGPAEGVGPLRVSSMTGPQAADLRICLLAAGSLYCSRRQPDREERTPPRSPPRSRPVPGQTPPAEAVSTTSAQRRQRRVGALQHGRRPAPQSGFGSGPRRE